MQVLFQRSLQGGKAQYPLQTVLDFLEQNKLDKHCAIFKESGMDGDLLLEADDSVLEELGIASTAERLKIKVHGRWYQLKSNRRCVLDCIMWLYLYLIHWIFVCHQVLFRHSLQGGEVQYPLQTVLDFLAQQKLDKYSAIFREWDINGDLLLEVDDSVLKELGVKSALDRNRIKTKYKTFVKSQL